MFYTHFYFNKYHFLILFKLKNIYLEMIYQVLLVSNIDCLFSSTIWFMLAGSLGTTTNLYLPSNSLQFTFDVNLINYFINFYLFIIYSIKILAFYQHCVLVNQSMKKSPIHQNGF